MERALLEQAPDAVIFAGTDGMIAFWNEAATRVFGHSIEAAMGQSLDIIIPEVYRDRHWTGYDRALADRETKYKGEVLPTKAMRADGAEIYVELGFAMVKNPDGSMAGAMAVARDITERFNRDRDMRRKLRELEAAAKG